MIFRIRGVGRRSDTANLVRHSSHIYHPCGRSCSSRRIPLGIVCAKDSYLAGVRFLLRRRRSILFSGLDPTRVMIGNDQSMVNKWRRAPSISFVFVRRTSITNISLAIAKVASPSWPSEKLMSPSIFLAEGMVTYEVILVTKVGGNSLFFTWEKSGLYPNVVP